MPADDEHTDSVQVDELPVGQKPLLTSQNVSMNEPHSAHTQSCIVVTSDLQTSWCRIQLRVQSSILPTSSARSLDNSQLRANFEFKKSPAVGHKPELSVSVDAEKSHVAPLSQQPESQRLRVQAQAATATVTIDTNLKASRRHSRSERLKGKTMIRSTPIPTSVKTPREAGVGVSTTDRANLDNSTPSSSIQPSLNASNWASTTTPQSTVGEPLLYRFADSLELTYVGGQDSEYSDGLREWHLGLLYKKLHDSGQTQGKSAMVICVCCA